MKRGKAELAITRISILTEYKDVLRCKDKHELQQIEKESLLPIMTGLPLIVLDEASQDNKKLSG